MHIEEPQPRAISCTLTVPSTPPPMSHKQSVVILILEIQCIPQNTNIRCYRPANVFECIRHSIAL